MTGPWPNNGETKLSDLSARSIWFLPFFNNLRAIVVLGAVRLGHDIVVLIQTVFPPGRGIVVGVSTGLWNGKKLVGLDH